MSEIFRKHYSYGETIPILDTNVGLTTDIFEETDRPAPIGPYLKAVLCAHAGPIKSSPMIVEPLQDNNSKILHLANIPVPIPFVRTVDMSLICDIVNYRWTASPDVQQRDNGVVTFDLRLRSAFSVLGKSFTLQLDQRPCTITLTKQLAMLPVQFQAAMVAPATSEGAVQQPGQPVGMPGYRPEVGVPPGNGGSESATVFTNQLDLEERLRELGTKILTRS